jgi:hypothetical protein
MEPGVQSMLPDSQVPTRCYAHNRPAAVSALPALPALPAVPEGRMCHFSRSAALTDELQTECRPPLLVRCWGPTIAPLACADHVCWLEQHGVCFPSQTDTTAAIIPLRCIQTQKFELLFGGLSHPVPDFSPFSALPGRILPRRW